MKDKTCDTTITKIFIETYHKIVLRVSPPCHLQNGYHVTLSRFENPYEKMIMNKTIAYIKCRNYVSAIVQTLSLHLI